MKIVAYNKNYARISNNTAGIVSIIFRFSTVIVVIGVGWSYFSKWFDDFCLADEYTDEKKQPISLESLIILQIVQFVWIWTFVWICKMYENMIFWKQTSTPNCHCGVWIVQINIININRTYKYAPIRRNITA